MDLLQLVKQLDESVFLYLNNLPHNFLLDKFFLFFSFYPVVTWIVIGIIMILFEEKKDKLFIIRLFLALGLAGLLSSGILKPLIKRPRPDLAYGGKVTIIQEKPAVIFWNNDYAFPSGHAAIAFAGAYILTQQAILKAKKSKFNKYTGNFKIFYLIALLTAVSRIYLGKHYPIDVILGGFIGLLMGFVAWKLIDLVFPKNAY
ncbi:MAG: Phosphoesterase PA-phosphatase related protein [Candidatus Gottesmanbacteria bacterium GW2011_GWA1_34_13]|uniref:Phosphoesterase PA-phosphatase related protein n=1 Tax=Candidatus Gottesmanbacteria bacterium GW2011_GWA1_34_13 TaxID=1618434 RepID=A0A0G0D8V6_9BACT|nr:MAG: Phosphoesterase PA-phosphatase related protein [Candidatus Gottesmanbacteria bacterium GW2011_GWA1_34_13]